MKKKKATRIVAAVIGLALLVAAAITVKIAWFPSSAPYATYTSPDGRYRIEAYIYAHYTNYLPIAGGMGAGSEGPGFVRLIGPNAKIYGETKVSDVIVAAGSKDDVEWDENNGKVFGGSGDAMFEFKIPKERSTGK